MTIVQHLKLHIIVSSVSAVVTLFFGIFMRDRCHQPWAVIQQSAPPHPMHFNREEEMVPAS